MIHVINQAYYYEQLNRKESHVNQFVTVNVLEVDDKGESESEDGSHHTDQEKIGNEVMVAGCEVLGPEVRLYELNRQNGEEQDQGDELPRNIVRSRDGSLVRVHRVVGAHLLQLVAAEVDVFSFPVFLQREAHLVWRFSHRSYY